MFVFSRRKLDVDLFFVSSRRRHTRWNCDWSSDVCSSDLVDARKGAVKWMVADYERTAIRPHALGKFRDLLLATAYHPAMLFYLDNWMSTKADLVVPTGPLKG